MKYSKNVQKRRCFEGIHDTIEMLRQFLYIYSTVKHNKYVTTCSILLVCMLGTHYDRTRFQIRDCRYQTLTITLTLTLENSTQKPCCDNFLVPTCEIGKHWPVTTGATMLVMPISYMLRQHARLKLLKRFCSIIFKSIIIQWTKSDI